LHQSGLLRSAHDVSEGGLFLALLESALVNDLGFDVVANDYKIRKDAQWFGEKQSRVIISVRKEDLAAVIKLVGNHPCEELGIVTEGEILVDGMDWGSIQEWKTINESSIENYLSKEAAGSALSAI
jgi:phosphoribosylformylglycinamidine synthase